ncbi:MAG TPA: hypothetical protein VMR18_05040 [Candidatus Saccharimonadales bacterium]|jgi:hypothetical protein|nr:hypothetical protein [Candidatus Saccharimonadales bacterium]
MQSAERKKSVQHLREQESELGANTRKRDEYSGRVESGWVGRFVFSRLRNRAEHKLTNNEAYIEFLHGILGDQEGSQTTEATREVPIAEEHTTPVLPGHESSAAIIEASDDEDKRVSSDPVSESDSTH